VWSNSNFANPAGVTVFTLINAGRLRDRGAEIDLSTPVVKRVKLNASLNLFDERAPIGVTAGARSEDVFRYTTNSTLEWTGPDRGKIPGDVAQLQWGVNSSSRQVQFSRTLSLTGSMSRQSRNRHELIAPLVQENYAERRPLEFKLKLLRTFGKP
jgi:outer membrane receptor for ferrienterochelin and colicin